MLKCYPGGCENALLVLRQIFPQKSTRKSSVKTIFKKTKTSETYRHKILQSLVQMNKYLFRNALVGMALGTAIFNYTSEVHAADKFDRKGKAAYKKECALCHGVTGKGDGAVAPFLFPKPRNFTTGIYKIRSTPTLPTDDDLVRIIDKGVPGTLMPSFAQLSIEEQKALVAYIKKFSDKFVKEGTLKPVIVPKPIPKTQELLAEGKEFYKEFGCNECHGLSGRGDGPSAPTLKDSWGEPIVPYDFTIPGRMKAGSSVEVIYRTLAAGIGGTPMPAYGEPMNQEEQNMYWAIAYFVDSLKAEGATQSERGDSAVGQNLFAGSTRFKNGGTPCMACHNIDGISALGGGVMGPDLTIAYNKFKKDGLHAIISDMIYPTMNAIFAEKPVTFEEADALIGYLEDVSLNKGPQIGNNLLFMVGAGVIGTILLFGLYFIIWSRRKKGSVNQDIYDRQIKSE